MDEKEIIRLLRSAALIPPYRATHPEIGDTVVESTKFNPDPTMIGVWEQILDPDGQRVFIVRSLVAGEMQRWNNADVLTIKIKSGVNVRQLNA